MCKRIPRKDLYTPRSGLDRGTLKRSRCGKCMCSLLITVCTGRSNCEKAGLWKRELGFLRIHLPSSVCHGNMKSESWSSAKTNSTSVSTCVGPWASSRAMIQWITLARKRTIQSSISAWQAAIQFKGSSSSRKGASMASSSSEISTTSGGAGLSWSERSSGWSVCSALATWK